jgi:hypothetical protein
MSEDQMFSQEERKFSELWSPIAEELRQKWFWTPQCAGMPVALTMPSREFLVTQAVLNALHEHYKSHIDNLGTSGAMRRLIRICGWEHGQPAEWFLNSVRYHFAALEDQYHA